MTESVALVFAYLLDLLIGDPRWMPHPVRWIGWTIGKMEGKLRALIVDADHGTAGTGERRKKEEMKAGVLLAVMIVGFTYLIFSVAGVSRHNAGLATPGSVVSLLVFIYLVSSALATRDLIKSGRAVINEVHAGNIDKARAKLGMIVGRDTGKLDERGILKAVIESVSENASDGIVAPMFYFALGGLPLAMAYKAVNTLDSMVGYRNDTYRHFGRAAAKLDDVANYIPARMTGILIVAAAYSIHAFRHVVHKGVERSSGAQGRAGVITGKLFTWLGQRTEIANFEGGLRAFEIMKRDGRKHESPNSGVPEAAMAGALGVRLGGPSIYGGRLVEKPYIGEEFQFREFGTGDGAGTYVSASKEALLITKIVSLFGLIISLLLLSLRAALWS